MALSEVFNHLYLRAFKACKLQFFKQNLVVLIRHTTLPSTRHKGISFKIIINTATIQFKEMCVSPFMFHLLIFFMFRYQMGKVKVLFFFVIHYMLLRSLIKQECVNYSTRFRDYTSFENSGIRNNVIWAVFVEASIKFWVYRSW